MQSSFECIQIIRDTLKLPMEQEDREYLVIASILALTQAVREQTEVLREIKKKVK